MPGEIIYETSFTIPTPISIPATPPVSDEGFIKEIIKWLAYKARRILREADIHARVRASPRQFIYRHFDNQVRIIDDDGNEIIVESGQIKMAIIGADLDEWNILDVIFVFEGKTVTVKVIYSD